MLLTIDLGNTNLTLGLYNGNNLVAHWRLATDHNRMPDEYGLQFQGLLNNVDHTTKELTGICLASVVPQLTQRVVQACREYLEQEPFPLCLCADLFKQPCVRNNGCQTSAQGA